MKVSTTSQVACKSRAAARCSCSARAPVAEQGALGMASGTLSASAAVTAVATTSCEAAAQATKRPSALASTVDELPTAARSAAALMPAKRRVTENAAVPAKGAKGACEAETASGELVEDKLMAVSGVPDGVKLTAVSLGVGVPDALTP